jgi:hypothetical protein
MFRYGLVYFLVYNECIVSRYQALFILSVHIQYLLTPAICRNNIYLLHIHVLEFSFAIWTKDISISGIQCPPTGLQLSMQQFLRFFSVFFCFGYDILFRRNQNLGSFLCITVYWSDSDELVSILYAVMFYVDRHNNNNQAFYSQASWGRLEMKPHEQKRRENKER